MRIWGFGRRRVPCPGGRVGCGASTALGSWGGEFISWGGEFVSWGGEFVSWGGEIVSWGGDIISWGGEIISWGGEIVSWGGEIISWGLRQSGDGGRSGQKKGGRLRVDVT